MTELLDALRQLRRALSHPVVSVGAVLVLLAIGGFVAILLGWRGAAATTAVPFQVPYLLSGGVVGLALVVLALGLLDTHLNRALAAAQRQQREELLREAVAMLAAVPARRD